MAKNNFDRLKYLKCMPFFGLSNYKLYLEFQSATMKFTDLFRENNLLDFLNNSLTSEMTSSYECKYYDEISFTNNFVNATFSQSSLSGFHINLQSSYKNLNLLRANMLNLKFPFQIIGITETGKRSIGQLENTFPEYSCFYTHPEAHKGGVAVFILKDNFSIINQRCDLQMNDREIESIWIEIKHNNDIYIIGTVYRHPNTSYDKFELYMEETFNKLLNEKATFFLQGDINIDLLQPTAKITSKYLDLLLTNNILPCVSLPTRICDSSASALDHVNVFRPLNKMANKILCGCLLLDISDHIPTFFMLPINAKKTLVGNKRPKTRLFGEKNMYNFKLTLSKTTWNDVVSNTSCEDAYNNFFVTFSNIYNSSFPVVTVFRTKIKSNPWMNKGLLVCIKHRNRLFRKCHNNPQNTSLFQRYKTYRNKINNLIKRVQREYYKSKLNEDKANLSHIWKVYAEIMGKNRKTTNRVDKLIVGKKTVVTDVDISNTFNEFFTTVGAKLAANYPNNTSHRNYLPSNEYNEHGMFLTPAKDKELLDILQSLDKKKSAGIDDIVPKVVSECAILISRPLLHIINLSFAQGYFPTQLKISKTIPLYKKAETFLPGNYRPISLLSIFSKILQKLMHKRLYSFLSKFNILFDLQFGFREKYSTTLALIEIVDNIRREVDIGKSVIGIYLDLSKAFDCVNHDKLLEKLNHCGIRGVANSWFKSYLSNRTQKTYVNGVYSSSKSVPVGVPQGSVLGPVLFLIYVNDIKHVLAHNQLRLFADDTNVFISGNNINAMQVDAQLALSKLAVWFEANQLTLNISKTCFTVFSKKIKNLDIKLQLKGHDIPQVVSAKYLGIILDKDLNFKPHCIYIKSKLLKLTSVMHHLSSFIGKDDVRRIYYAYIFPHIKYAIEVFGLSSVSNNLNLQKCQNKLLKILCKSDYQDSPTILHTELAILNIKEISLLFLSLFVYKQQNGLLPSVFDSYFCTNQELQRRSHRRQELLFVPNFRLVYGQKSVCYIAAKLWNQLPIEIRNSSTQFSFKYNVKHFLKEGINESFFNL